MNHIEIRNTFAYHNFSATKNQQPSERVIKSMCSKYTADVISCCESLVVFRADEVHHKNNYYKCHIHSLLYHD